MVNSGMNMPHSNVEAHKVKMIEFGLLNPEEIVSLLYLIFSSKCQYVK
jgi:hypothetical protein